MGRRKKVGEKEIAFDNSDIESTIDFSDKSLFEDIPREKEIIETAETESVIVEDELIGKESAMAEVEGIGDIIHIVTKAVGIEQCDACKQRQKLLNQMFPFIKQAKKLTDENIEFLKRIKTSSIIGSADRQTLFDLYNYTMSAKLVACACPGVMISMIDKLWNIYLANYSKNPDEK